MLIMASNWAWLTEMPWSMSRVLTTSSNSTSFSRSSASASHSDTPPGKSSGSQRVPYPMYHLPLSL